MFLRLFPHSDRRAASLEACTLGNNRATKTPMIATTVNSSTKVKAFRAQSNGRCMVCPSIKFHWIDVDHREHFRRGTQAAESFVARMLDWDSLQQSPRN